MRRISYAQTGEDIRVWHAFAEQDPAEDHLTYVDVGANEPRHLSITASLYDQGWRGLLIEADPVLAEQLRIHRPGDTVVELAASSEDGTLTFFRIPGTGLGTLDAEQAAVARERGFAVDEVVVPTRRLDDILRDHGVDAVHFMSVDVEGAEPIVLQGLSLDVVRPWVLCVEAVYPGTEQPSHGDWEPALLAKGYTFAAFDGVNRWYVADEHADLVDRVATPFNVLDVGIHGWVQAHALDVQQRADRAGIRRAWQRELILHDQRHAVPASEYEKQINELRGALIAVEGSRSWRYTRKGVKVLKVLHYQAHRAMAHLPRGVQQSLVRRRHLAHVVPLHRSATNPAYLGNAPTDSVQWISPDRMPPLPGAGLDVEPLTAEQQATVRAWLDAGPYDTDALLDARVDNHDDELGHVMEALRLRLAIAGRTDGSAWAGGRCVLVDVRSLQASAFAARGIGRYAAAMVEGARAAVGDERVVLLVDPALDVLPVEIVGGCEQVTRVTERSLPRFSVLLQPSPMTASSEPLLPILFSSAHKVAVVHDFIPLHYPTIYLRHAGARAEYAAAMDALRRYDEFLCNSDTTAREVERLLGGAGPGALRPSTIVAWPANVSGSGEPAPAAGGTGPIVIISGDEPRKNTLGALAAVGAATAGREEPRQVQVLGMSGHDAQVQGWSLDAAIRIGETTTLPRLSDEEMDQVLRDASLVVVASFDEGLSLPVIEAVRAGAPVVASDIPAHRELIGRGSYLADPGDVKAMARAIRSHAGRTGTQQAQARHLVRHAHVTVEEAVATTLAANLKSAEVDLAQAAIHVSSKRLSVGFATPWTPQRSGVADYSAATTPELARHCDVTVYTTTDARVDGLAQRSIGEVIERGSEHDVFVTVLGNSHFHLPFLEVMKTVDSVAVAHDTRMVEFYYGLRGAGGLAQVMTRGQASRAIRPPIEEQISDMRLLQNAGMWEIAQRARMLVMHSPSAAPRIERETGVAPRLLPFANQRVPHTAEVTEAQRREARTRLGLDAGSGSGTVHLASFGYVDLRTKMTDLVVEAAAWLTQWGHRVSLHLVGSAEEGTAAQLTRQAQQAGIANFQITGFQSDEQFRDWLLAVDLGVQLRVSPLLGVSGPLSDLAAFGTTSVASAGLCIDVDTPDYVDRLPDEVSPVMVAEAIEHRLQHPIPHDVREQQRVEYLDRKSPARYAEGLFALLAEAAGMQGA